MLTEEAGEVIGDKIGEILETGGEEIKTGLGGLGTASLGEEGCLGEAGEGENKEIDERDSFVGFLLDNSTILPEVEGTTGVFVGEERGI